MSMGAYVALKSTFQLSRCADCQFLRYQCTDTPAEMEAFEMSTDNNPDGLANIFLK